MGRACGALCQLKMGGPNYIANSCQKGCGLILGHEIMKSRKLAAVQVCKTFMLLFIIYKLMYIISIIKAIFERRSPNL
jgi:hypothetical protein